jgi:tRNA(Ile)-lysidine synthase
MDLIQQVKKTIDEYSMLNKTDKVIVSVSGGADSVFLLYALYQLNLDLCIAHINYKLRGDESDLDEEFVKELAKKLNLKIYIKRVDTLAYCKEKGLSIQMAARRLRYEFYDELIKELSYTAVATGHTLDDNVETILLFLLRGCGQSGLCGIPPIRYNQSYKIIRPLIKLKKSIIKEYLDSQGIVYRIDSSNTKLLYKRNKIRLKLLPILKKYGNIEDNLINLSELITLDEEYLSKQALEYYKTVLLKEDRNEIILNRIKLMNLPKPLLYRIIREGIKRIDNLQDISYQNIKDIEKLIINEHKKSAENIFLPKKNLIIKRVYNNLIIQKNKTEKSILRYNYVVEIGKTLTLSQNSFFKSSILERKNFTMNFNNRSIAYLDYDKIKFPIYIRNRKPGDRFRPYGMFGSKKLKDFFIDLKVEREKRDTIPLVVDNSENILWVVGYRISHDVAITEDTKKILKLEYFLNS